ncbi:MAG: Trm112 family protein [Chloroflexi bacterium]|nr:MAG: Trm112 family protein [Chloroflexota bacterium]TMB77191.1 MAG: Trm112 family protein [Chloroflexota bacterium]TMC30659.1 MAG: Trm112 family protein [Chloroflexota bacterium]TMC33339.1 MAG: Trm112 family protein [Chloroflexota bacterium]TMC58781.1 MAG: Trm112 family protein [Chloroflexota bacterium]
MTDTLPELVCPVDRAQLRQDHESLVCSRCGRRFPIRDGIPVLLEDEALAPQSSSDR